LGLHFGSVEGGEQVVLLDQGAAVYQDAVDEASDFGVDGDFLVGGEFSGEGEMAVEGFREDGSELGGLLGGEQGGQEEGGARGEKWDLTPRRRDAERKAGEE
jgi:hypothetical protein